MTASSEIRLRIFTPEDAEHLAVIANNPKVAANLRDAFPCPYAREDAVKFIADAMAANPTNRFAIEWKGQHVGNVGIFPGEDIYRLSAEIGYFIAEPYWGKGIATEAVRQIVEYGFSTLGMIRIYAGVFAYNPASMKVLEKCGFQKEGIARNALIKNGKIWDEHRYAIIRGEL